MSNTETVVGITEELQPCPSTEVVYAWGEAEDEPETDDLPSGVSYRPMIAVTALAAVALAIAALAAVVVLVTPMRANHYDLRPLPVQAAPALKPAPASPPILLEEKCSNSLPEFPRVWRTMAQCFVSM